MIVYRIAKSLERARDISGFGAFKFGGRWNSKGTYTLYTSVNSSLAYLENLAQFNETDIPPNLFIAFIEIKAAETLTWQLPDNEYPPNWQTPENYESKLMGDKWMNENKFLVFKVRSVINPSEYNFLLNPLFAGYHDKVNVISTELLNIDTRLVR